jgi:Trypsin-like peptidase domain
MTSLNWSNPVSGDWSDPSKWLSGTTHRVPTANDDVYINTSGNGAYTLNISSFQAAHKLAVDVHNATLNIAGAGTLQAMYDENSGTIHIGGKMLLGPNYPIGPTTTFDNTGTIENYGELALTYATLKEHGKLATTTGSKITLTGSTIDDGNWANSGTVTVAAGSRESHLGGTVKNSGAIVVNDAAVLDLSGTIANSNSIEADGRSRLVLDNAAITNAGAGTVKLAGGTLDTVAGTHDEIDSKLVLSPDGKTNTTGRVVVEERASLKLLGGVAGAGNAGFCSFTGSAAIQGSGALELGGAAKLNIGFDPNTNGTLKLDASSSFQGRISGFGPGNTIDLSDVKFGHTTTTYTQNGPDSGTLRVTDGVHTANLVLSGTYNQDSFHLASDGKGGTSLSYQIDCVCQIWTYDSEGALRGSGSGAIIGDHTVLTAAHVLDGASRVEISYGGKTISGPYNISYNAGHPAGTGSRVGVGSDFGVIDFSPSTFGHSLALSPDYPGGSVTRVGYPYGSAVERVTQGAVSISANGFAPSSFTSDTLAPGLPGESGGPLLDGNNRVVGVTSTPEWSVRLWSSDVAQIHNWENAEASHNGALQINGTPSGTNLAVVDGGGTIEIAAGVSEDVNFGPKGGTLKLDDPSHFSGTVAGFGIGDKIDFAGFDASKVSWSYVPKTNTLTVAEGPHMAKVALMSQFMMSNFTASSDGHGGTIISIRDNHQDFLTPPAH